VSWVIIDNGHIYMLRCWQLILYERRKPAWWMGRRS